MGLLVPRSKSIECFMHLIFLGMEVIEDRLRDTPDRFYLLLHHRVHFLNRLDELILPSVDRSHFMVLMLAFSEDTVRTEEFVITLAVNRNHTVVF